MKNMFLKIGIVVVTIMVVLVSVLLIRGKTENKQNPVATIQIEGYDKPIKLELDPASAPDAVANFIKLANNGFYSNCKLTVGDDKLSVDKSIESARLSNIMEQPQDDYIYGIKGDVMANGVENLINHSKGVITMEISFDNITSYQDLYNSANARFSILTKNINGYNGTYAAFGKVVEGMEVLDEISATNISEEKNNDESTEGNKDTENTENTEDIATEDNSEKEESGASENSEEKTVTIKSISVETYGVDYGVPEVFNFNPKTTNTDESGTVSTDDSVAVDQE